MLFAVWLVWIIAAGFGRALSQQVLHQCLVLLCRRQVGLAFQGGIVGVDRRFQLPGPGQSVAAIVVVRRIVALGEARGGFGVVAGLVERHALPAWVLEVQRRLGRPLSLQQALALLVRAQPEVLEIHGQARARQYQQQRQAEQPATAPGARRDQQQGEQQPVALVGPGRQPGDFAAVAQAGGAIEQAQAAQVVFIQLDTAVTATQFGGETAQLAAVELGQEDGALVVLEEATVFLGDRRARCRTDSEDSQALRAGAQGLANAGLLPFVEAIGDQQQAALALGSLFQQFEGAGDGQVGAVTRRRHDRGLQGLDQVEAGHQVVGQRHQAMGAAGVDDDCRLRIAAGVQQVAQLASGLLQAARCNVGGKHRRRQLQHHHQRVGAFLRALFHQLPAGPEQCQQAQQPGQAEGQPGQAVVAQPAAAEQPGLEGAGQQLLPASAAAFTVPELPEQPAQEGQQ
ncbi:hypothetical protein D9M72_436550 [compost metagenome]